MRPLRRLLLALSALSLLPSPGAGSVAREWNEVMLQAIRKDLARPTVQARNLFHFSVAIYDAWAAYEPSAQPFLLGRDVGGFLTPFTGVPVPADREAAREEAISYAARRVLRHRYQTSPGSAASLARFDSLFLALGYDPAITSTNYASGSPAALGNYIGQAVIAFGLQDGSNEANGYANVSYLPVNSPLILTRPGDSTLTDPNRWQPLAFSTFIDQNGNVSPDNVPPFLSAEWGNVTPFAMDWGDVTFRSRGGRSWRIYHDPGPPPLLDTLDAQGPGTRLYQWGYTLVGVWSSHLKSADPVLMDISPASLGNNEALPATSAGMPAFYNLLEGGDAGTGRALNPRTGMPYAPQLVPRGDYARSLAEFWADGPSSETPPGHWFTILNHVSDQPQLVKRIGGAGPVVSDLEWDVKAYFALGGAVHDAAIACWSVKGWYDAVRPISAIRWMAERGQSSDSLQSHYSPAGLPLVPGQIELVAPGDPLAGEGGANVHKIKLRAWRGPAYVGSPATDTAGVGWILGENWWPYQRPTFVTPPFAGYMSGHSTYSRAAAEVMTRFTGDEYFPGGMTEFLAPRNLYLVFEDGPSVDVRFQWATYRDASDQCSLSRIWGGIHSPVDDLPGRLAGALVGNDAFDRAQQYFTGSVPTLSVTGDRPGLAGPLLAVFPNPVASGAWLTAEIEPARSATLAELFTVTGQRVRTVSVQSGVASRFLKIGTHELSPGVYLLRVRGPGYDATRRLLVVR